MSRRKRFIEDFIIPSLKKKTFGSLLEWVDEANKIFSISWTHKSSGDWREEDFSVFVHWSRMNNKFDENDPECYTKVKGRVRSSLYKLKEKVVPLKTSKISKYKLFQLKNFKKDKQKCQLHAPDSLDVDDDKDLLQPKKEEDINMKMKILNENKNIEIKDKIKEQHQLSPTSDYASECESNEDISETDSSFDKNENCNLQKNQNLSNKQQKIENIKKFLKENEFENIHDASTFPNNQVGISSNDFYQNCEGLMDSDTKLWELLHVFSSGLEDIEEIH